MRPYFIPRRPFRRPPPRNLHKINEAITATEVRVVGENIAQGVYPVQKALELAKAMELDLVEIAPQASPPVCRIVDYSKYLYEQKKKEKGKKAKSVKTVIKELRFGPNTDEHDFAFKLRHAKNFLADGAKVKALVFFKGRSIVYKEKGEILLLRLARELENEGVAEQMPAMEGKRMIMLIGQKKKK